MTYTQLQKDINQMLDKLAKDIYTNKYNKVYLEDIFKKNKEFFHSLIDQKDISSSFKVSLKNNIDEFLSVKNYLQYKDSLNLIQNKKYEEFLIEFKDLNKKYNSTWLQTEADFVKGKINIVEKLESYKNLNKEKYYYKYITAGDESVRDSHKQLNGLTLPIDHPFWQSHFPPWEFGCRCSLIAIRKGTETDGVVEKSEKIAEKTPKNKEGFGINVYKEGKVFTDKNSYFEKTKKTGIDPETVIKKLKK